MDERTLLLAIPTTLVACALLFHSFRALPRGRAAAFWLAAAAYGIARGWAVRLITERGLGASVPYAFERPGPQLLGVGLQEVAGWSIVAYLGWWLGCRWARTLGGRCGVPLFAQAVWACLFLAAASWAVETAAATAGWWHWTIPASSGILGSVPPIGVLDWSLVAIDFLLPYLAFTAPGAHTGRLKWAALAAFPLHFAAHLVPRSTEPGAALFDLVHGGLILLLFVLALDSRAGDDAFEREPEGLAWVPLAAVATITATLAVAIVWFGGRAELLVALVPLITLTLCALRPRLDLALLGACAALAFLDPRFLLAAVPPAAASLLHATIAGRRVRKTALAAAVAAACVAAHLYGARAANELKEGLERAIAARDRGDLAGAVEMLTALAQDGPRSHVPLALLGQINYRSGRLDAAAAAFERAVAIQPGYAEGHRYLAVIALRNGRRDAALAHARRGLALHPGDLELAYLRQSAGGPAAPEFWPRLIAAGPGGVSAVASLAYEVNDARDAAQIVERGLARWPGDPLLTRKHSRLAADTLAAATER